MKQAIQQIPVGWKTIKISEICQILSGSTPKTSENDYWDGNIPWFTPLDLSKISSRYVKKSERQITESGFKACSAQKIPPYSLIMSSRAPIGYFAINIDASTTNQGCKTFVCSERVKVDFLYYYLNQYLNEIKRLASGSTFAEVGKKQLEGLEITLPSLPEQSKIATILSKVDEEIEKVEKIIEETEKLKKGVMKKLLTKGIGHTKFKQSELGEIPEEWEVVKLKDKSGKIQYGYTESSKNEEVGPKFLRITDIVNGKVQWKHVPYCKCEEVEKYQLKKGDIVFARTGATTGKSFYIENPPVSVFASYLIRVTVSSEFISKFVYYFFQSSKYWDQINSSVSGSAQGGVNATKLGDLRLPLPPLLEQKGIINSLSAIDDKILINQKIRSALLKLKKGLMIDLLSGRVRTI